jgi:hypothetical protein
LRANLTDVAGGPTLVEELVRGAVEEVERVQRNARRKRFACLLAEDAFTPSVSKRFQFSFSKPPRAAVCKPACATSQSPRSAPYSSRTVVFLFPAIALILRLRSATPLLAKKRRISGTNLLRNR